MKIAILALLKNFLLLQSIELYHHHHHHLNALYACLVKKNYSKLNDNRFITMFNSIYNRVKRATWALQAEELNANMS